MCHDVAASGLQEETNASNQILVLDTANIHFVFRGGPSMCSVRQTCAGDRRSYRFIFDWKREDVDRTVEVPWCLSSDPEG